ncbi:glycosyl hydrolase family 28 protein [Sphingomonas sp. GC_Shp_3]|uniref:glycoside hydrolase family 28 protein n=1 Tax=Sphingomonas sp. GC_Shp_3 TaxID=2937383 RepID=UPI00226A7F12|nr:glycosyl hydrolase family 28 protein [Sphingomonas sp. GC_Shp_3]
MMIERRSLLSIGGMTALAAAVMPAAVGARHVGRAAPTLPQRRRKPHTGVRLDPRAFGATGDGITKDTAAIQQALDRCAVFGGGVVALAGGTFLTGAVRIGSNTELRIEAGATLQGSADVADYPIVQVRWEGRWVPGHVGLVWAQDARGIVLSGDGRIVGSRAIPGRMAPSGLRNPALLEFVAVHGLEVRDLVTEQNDMWSIHPVYCTDATFSGLTIKGGADGIDLDSCQRVEVRGCDFDTADDCISLKSGRGMEGAMLARPTEDVTITGCTFRDRRWACIGIGSETSGGIRRVLVERCTFVSAYTFSIYIKSRPGRGAFIEDITMRDLDVAGAGGGFLRLNLLDSGKQDPFPVPGPAGIPTVRNLVFERVRVKHVPVLVEAVDIHPDKPLNRFVMRDFAGMSGRGITLANMRDVVLDRIDVAVASGPKIAASGVSGRGLDGAETLPSVPRPPPVIQEAGQYRLGQPSGAPN